MKNSIITLILFALFSLTQVSSASGKHHSETTTKLRDQAAAAALKKSPSDVVVYAKGLICESCAIGIRKKLQRLDFIDTRQPNKGIQMNPQTQLVTITVKRGALADGPKISKAIRAAGYDPVSLYLVNAKRKVQKSPLK